MIVGDPPIIALILPAFGQDGAHSDFLLLRDAEIKPSSNEAHEKVMRTEKTVGTAELNNMNHIRLNGMRVKGSFLT